MARQMVCAPICSVLTNLTPPPPDDIFRCIFVNEKLRNLIKISLMFVPKGPTSAGLDNGSAPNRRQVIIWINVDSILWRIYMREMS